MIDDLSAGDKFGIRKQHKGRCIAMLKCYKHGGGLGNSVVKNILKVACQ
jgi:hypothetical protein